MAESKGKPGVNVNQYANWWDDVDTKKDKKKVVTDNTPDEIKNNDVYKDMIKRFLSGSFKDKALEKERAEEKGTAGE